MNQSLRDGFFGEDELQIHIGANLTINTYAITIGNTVGIYANDSYGSNGYVLTSNGTTVYWASVGSAANQISITAPNFSPGPNNLNAALITKGPFGGGIVLNDSATSNGLGVIWLQSFANVMMFGLGNTSSIGQSLCISSNGNIGVGTTTPGLIHERLQVRGDLSVANNPNNLMIYGYSPSFQLLNKDATQNWYFGLDDDDSKKLKVGRGYGAQQGVSPSITIDVSDNVGIGVTGPQVKLHVSGSIQLNNNTAAISTPSGGGTLYVEAGALKFKGSGGTISTIAPA